jgi:hypothetical protein
VAPSTNDRPPRPAGEPPTGLPLSVTTEAKRKRSARGCCGDGPEVSEVTGDRVQTCGVGFLASMPGYTLIA